MEEDYESDNEGVIINTPKIMTLSNKSSIDKKINSEDYKKFSLSDKRISSFLLDNQNDNCDRIEKKNKTVIIDKNKFFMKNDDNNSTTSKSSINDKIKKVTFSTIEIIRVKNFKRFNKLNSAPKNEEINESDNANCIMY